MFFEGILGLSNFVMWVSKDTFLDFRSSKAISKHSHLQNQIRLKRWRSVAFILNALVGFLLEVTNAVQKRRF